MNTLRIFTYLEECFLPLTGTIQGWTLSYKKPELVITRSLYSEKEFVLNKWLGLDLVTLLSGFEVF